jgi:hypothetical protein
MTPVRRPSDFDARFLRRLVGTKVSTFYDINHPEEPSTISYSWIVTEKLYEVAAYLTKEDCEIGVGTPMTVSVFLCHLEKDPTQIAFMRLYHQILVTGTEDADLATLAQHVCGPEVCGELEAFKQLRSHSCTVSDVTRRYK